MSSPDTAAPEAVSAPSTQKRMNPYLTAGLGWLLPGLGHLLLKKYDRAAVFFVSIVAMAAIGLAMGAKLYMPPFEEGQGIFVGILHTLSFVGDLGAGVMFWAAYLAGFGREYLARASGDYGTVFFLCAGLLNLLTVLDAYDIATGAKE